MTDSEMEIVKQEIKEAYEKGFVDGIKMLSDKMKEATDAVVIALTEYNSTNGSSHE